MQIHTRFFATYRELMGTAEMEVSLPDGATVEDLVGVLRGRGGDAVDLPVRPAVAVNRTYSRLGQTLVEGDEVAFIPPVAGG